jgi:hydroxymethylpyrimidine/phosphomethylpyrimidine kinase
VALTVAGYDPSSGAGITADLQVFSAHGIFGVSAVTALTVQSTVGVAGVQPVAGEWLRRTLEHLWEDLPAAGVKIGMLGSAEAVGVVAEFFRKPRAGGGGFPVVLDPVLRSSSGRELLPADGVERMREELLPQVDVITPNWAELGMLAGKKVRGVEEAREAMEILGTRYPGLKVVATGGDAAGEPVDVLREARGEVVEFRGERVETNSTHGTGCAFSSALLARLVRGETLREAVGGAKSYVAEALRRAPGFGSGRGPMELLWPLLGFMSGAGTE